MESSSDLVLDVLGDPSLREGVRAVIRRAWRPGTGGDPEDLIQEVTLSALSRRNEFRGSTPRHVFGWLRTIARNRVSDTARQRGRRPASRSINDDDLASNIDPSERASRDEMLARVMAGLSRLDAAILRARYDAGMNFEQIGKIIGRTADDARQIHHRLLAVLREMLGEAGI
jgi:RNA polymerase sigma factor (sigma-70 family)